MLAIVALLISLHGFYGSPTDPTVPCGPPTATVFDSTSGGPVG